ncbi:MAG: Arm DNA-binding domain-containing protein [Azoarcus sp.]|jgi:hypothetical protein|nr:Arm DNA-binding domain-containing protein [Azoarcus sp.]MDD2874475.1 Arm DNA-binding domain-containing protein [Azoarcus sp.]
MPLTDTQVKALKPEDKARKYADEKGLFLLVQPSGSKLWRLKYRFDGNEKLLAFGSYRDVGLKAARGDALGNSFEAVAREWFGHQIEGLGYSPGCAATVPSRH